MKRRIAKFLIYLIILALTLFGIYYVFFQAEPMELAYNNISECRQNYFTAQDELNKIVVSSGYREDPYIIDGIHTQNVEFGIVVLKTSLLNITAPSCILQVSGTDYSGAMEKNPYDNTYVFDIGKYLDANSVMTITIQIEGTEYNFEPTNISKDWQTGYLQAQEIGFNQLESYIVANASGKNFNAECYIKIVNDPSNISGLYYWYVSIVDTSGTTHSVIIDTSNGEILNSN